MRTLALTAAALVVATTAGQAQSGHQRTIYDRAWYEGGAQQRTPYAPPVDNRRPSFAAHVAPNGQGVE